MMKKLALTLVVALGTLAGCSGSSSNASGQPTTGDEEDLKQAECPAKVEVTIAAPSIPSDAKLLTTWEKDFPSDGVNDPAKEAQEQLPKLMTHLAKARSETAVTLRGTVGQRCFYATVDAKTGQPGDYNFWFAKTGGPHGELQLRISRNLDPKHDSLFFKQRLTALTPTSLTVDAAKDASIFAEVESFGFHGEPDGLTAWVGSAEITAKITP